MPEPKCVSRVAPCVESCPEPCADCCDWVGPKPLLGGLRRQAWALTLFTIAYNVVEAGIAVWTGLAAGSIALVGFGLDSVVEAASAVIIVWRLSRQGPDRAANEQVERRAVRLIGLTFFGLAAYVTYDSVGKLLGVGEQPEPTAVGLALVAVSLLVMPIIAWAKRRVATELKSTALTADAAETLLCSYLSAVVLVGLLANSLLGWWWLDPIAGLVVAAMAVREGREAWSGGELFEADEERDEHTEAAWICSPVCCPACPAA